MRKQQLIYISLVTENVISATYVISAPVYFLISVPLEKHPKLNQKLQVNVLSQNKQP